METDGRQAFDFDAAFDADYLYFYETFLTAERSEREVELIWKLLHLTPREDVLDTACGHGRIANLLARKGCRVVGIDVTFMFLDRARSQAAALGLEVEYIDADMRSLE